MELPLSIPVHRMFLFFEGIACRGTSEGKGEREELCLVSPYRPWFL